MQRARTTHGEGGTARETKEEAPINTARETGCRCVKKERMKKIFAVPKQSLHNDNTPETVQNIVGSIDHQLLVLFVMSFRFYWLSSLWHTLSPKIC